MPKLFKSPTSAVFEQRTKLKKYWDDDLGKPLVQFNIHDDTEGGHLHTIRKCTATLHDRLSKLQTIDIKLIAAFTVGISALILSFLPGMGALSIAAFTYAGYQMAQRQPAYAEYKLALENEAVCCAWSLGDVPGNDLRYLENDALKGMIHELAPIMNHQQLKALIDDDIEQQAVERAEKSIEKLDVFPGLPREEQRSLFYKVYGYEQGSFLNIFQGLAYGMQAGWRALTASAEVTHTHEILGQQPL